MMYIYIMRNLKVIRMNVVGVYTSAQDKTLEKNMV